MSAIFRHEGNAFDYYNTSGSTVSAGTILDLQNGMVGVVKVDIPAGQIGALGVEGVCSVTKANAVDVFAQGNMIDFSVVGQNVALAAGDSMHRAALPSLAGEESVWVKINTGAAGLAGGGGGSTAADQPQTDAGALGNVYVSPLTLAGYSGTARWVGSGFVNIAAANTSASFPGTPATKRYEASLNDGTLIYAEPGATTFTAVPGGTASNFLWVGSNFANIAAADTAAGFPGTPVPIGQRYEASLGTDVVLFADAGDTGFTATPAGGGTVTFRQVADPVSADPAGIYEATGTGTFWLHTGTPDTPTQISGAGGAPSAPSETTSNGVKMEYWGATAPTAAVVAETITITPNGSILNYIEFNGTSNATGNFHIEHGQGTKTMAIAVVNSDVRISNANYDLTSVFATGDRTNRMSIAGAFASQVHDVKVIFR